MRPEDTAPIACIVDDDADYRLMLQMIFNRFFHLLRQPIIISV
ncbi:hypothetical protein [Spirosoma arboris]|nr:hypothetical protein [Spirosoma arboris]